MTKPTITTLTIATLYFLVFGAVLGYSFVTVQSQKTEAKALRTELATQTMKQNSVRTVAATISSTEDVRNELATYFLPEKETISFIAEIEGLATTVGVGVETTALDIIREKDRPVELKTGFAVFGSRRAVLNFIAAIETLPYHSRTPIIRIERDGNTWRGQVDVFVTITP
jgi:hypothetical protein